MALFAFSAAYAQPDVLIKDCNADVGNEPNNNCGYFYDSPWIYVRNSQGAGTFGGGVHQSPICGQDNWVYVDLRNISDEELCCGTLYLYFAKASTGLWWEQSWFHNYLQISGGIRVYGDLIGAKQIGPLPGGNSQTVEFLWNTVPDPNQFGDPDARHFCLLARFVACDDPMTYPEGPHINPNVKNNNNIAWKNCSIVRKGTCTNCASQTCNPARVPIDVTNQTTGALTTTVRFTADDALLDHVNRVTVDLGELRAAWEEAGAQGKGFEDDGEKLILTEGDAEIAGINIAAGTRHTVAVEVVYNEENDPDVAGRVFNLHMTQHAGTGDEEILIGGEIFNIEMPEAGEGRPASVEPSLSQVLGLNAHPNPTGTSTMISFTLPNDMPVTLAIYDASGNLVEKLVSDVRTAGRHTIEWNGTSKGRQVPSGSYFYRVETKLGTVQEQIKIVR